MLRHIGESLLFTVLGLLGVVALGAAMIYVLPLLASWWGFAIGTAVVAAIVVAFDMDSF